MRIKWMALALLAAGCSKDDIRIKVHAPVDEVAHYCRNGEMQLKTGAIVSVSCEMPMNASNQVESLFFLPDVHTPSSKVHCDSDGECYLRIPGPPKVSTPMNEDALIVYIEPGTFEANKNNNLSQMKDFYERIETPNDPTYAQYTKPIIPHLRTFISNLVRAHIHQVMNTHGKKYGRIYFIKTDFPNKALFLQTIDKATHLHPKVDMIIFGHGEPGRWIFSSDLVATNESVLTSQELVNWAGLLGTRRNKIRSIFASNCFSAAEFGVQDSFPYLKTSDPKVSMSKAIATAFPMSKSYGSAGVNFFPIHRDLVAFEKYYESGDLNNLNNFDRAVAFANRLMQYTRGDTGYYRYNIHFPNLKAKGCVNLYITKKCQTESLPIDSIAVNDIQQLQSYPFIYNGVELPGQAPLLPPLVWNQPPAYIPKGSWPSYGFNEVTDVLKYTAKYENPLLYGLSAEMLKLYDSVIEPVAADMPSLSSDVINISLNPNQACVHPEKPWSDEASRIPAGQSIKINQTIYSCESGLLTSRPAPDGDPCENVDTGKTGGLCS